MKSFLYKKIQPHISLLIIGLGAVCFLLTNIILREILTEEDYGNYSLLVTYLSIAYLFGLLGFEQVFIRFSNIIVKNDIQTQRLQLKIIIGIRIVTAVLFTFFYFLYFQAKNPINILLLFLALYCIILSLFLFNVFRLNSQFIAAQLVANGWKIAMLFIAIIFFILNIKNLTLLTVLILTVVILITLWASVAVKTSLRFSYNNELNKKDTFSAFLLFFISISSFSIVMFADRFIIEGKLGTIVFGDYFYLTNFFIAPFSILQNYVGFKQVVYFKEHFNIQEFKKFSLKIFFLALGLGFLLVLMLLALIYLNFLNFDFLKYKLAILLLLILGIIRLHSSSILPAFEVKTSINSLKKANLYVILITILVSLLVIYLIDSLEGIIIGFIIIWLSRTLIYRMLLIKQEKENNQ